MRNLLLSGVALIALPGSAIANCPAISVADSKGTAPGAYPQQYELSAFEAAANCSMSFSAHPEIAALNDRIQGNGAFYCLSQICIGVLYSS